MIEPTFLSFIKLDILKIDSEELATTNGRGVMIVSISMVSASFSLMLIKLLLTILQILY